MIGVELRGALTDDLCGGIAENPLESRIDADHHPFRVGDDHIGAVVAFQLWKIYPAEIPSVNLDVDWVYRRAAPRVIRSVGGAISAVDGAVREAFVGTLRSAIRGAFRAHGPKGILARTWPAGSMVLWVSILLTAFLIFEFL